MTSLDPPTQHEPTQHEPTQHEPRLLRRAAALNDRLLDWRSARARSAGYRETVIPYPGYGSSSWVRVLGRVLLADPERERDRRSRGVAVGQRDPEGSRGWRSFTSVPVRDAVVDVEVDGTRHQVRSDVNGIVDALVPVSLTPGRHRGYLSADGSTPNEAWITVAAPEARFGVVSDIDDTVMITALPRPLLAAWHSFVVNEHARSTTPGMPVLYERLLEAHPQAPVIYLSTGAWNVAPTLTRFLSRNLYPTGPLLLTDWGPTPDRWFRSGPDHKRASLRRLATEFPEVKWLLFGDDGQHDEAIYAGFSAEFPGHVAAVCIRRLTPGEAVLAGSTNRSHSIGDGQVPWIYGYDGAELAAGLQDHGLLPTR
ncbi:MAG: App1 family protein [Propionibacteriaceae bacterium]